MKVSSLLAAAAGIALVTACGGSPTPSAGSGKTIKIALAAILSGAQAIAGSGQTNGMEFAIKQINDKGGVNGSKNEFVTTDIGSTPPPTLPPVHHPVHTTPPAP